MALSINCCGKLPTPKKLKELNLFDIYQEEAWPTLHQGLLAEYEKSLGRLLNSIKSKDVK